VSSFEQFGLPPFIAKSLLRLDFKTPTPIQQQAIGPAIEGHDIFGMAQTGTGKTAAFSIPLAVRLNAQPQQHALVLVPTRELAQQVHAFVRELAGKHQQMRIALIIGGASMHMQRVELRRGARIIIATPGRLTDHLRSDPKLLVRSSIVVVDEADRMMDMGFMPQLKQILKAVPRVRQTMMFSATFPPDIKNLAAQFMHKPVTISVGDSRPVEKIEQVVRQVTHKEKNDVLLDELNARQGSVLIFTRTKHRTDRLNKYLESYGYSTARIHGNRTLAQRKAAVDGFRSGKVRILVATDIVSRGIDIADIAHVINYDLPQAPEDYIHRIGRTARNGKGGQALCLLTPEDRGMWRAISKLV
jgi:ATP-dependent RNA helicase DeaD